MSGEQSIDTGRLFRTLTLVVFVTAVFLFLAANRLEGVVLRVGTVAIAAVGLVTAITGFLIAAAGSFDDS